MVLALRSTRPNAWRLIPVTLGFIGSLASVQLASGQTQQVPTMVETQAALPSRAIPTAEPMLLVPDSSPEAGRNREELERWTAEYTEWRDWMERWGSRRELGWFRIRERRPRPDPPEWLAVACENVYDVDPVVDRACALREEWLEDSATLIARKRNAASNVQTETQTKTLWWEHVHLDAFWPNFQHNEVAYGVVGTHATIDIAGRVEIFVAPGVIVLNLPAAGGRQWTAATDWGLAFKLGTFVIPGTSQAATLHINAAKAWVFAGANGYANGSIDLAGLSITFSR